MVGVILSSHITEIYQRSFQLVLIKRLTRVTMFNLFWTDKKNVLVQILSTNDIVVG